MAPKIRKRVSKVHEQVKREVHQSMTLAVSLIFLMLLIGTVFFHYSEEWSWIDSFYFSGVTMTTLGYGDLVPTTDISKVFVVFFSIITLGLFLYSASIIASKIVGGISIIRRAR